MLGYPIMIGVAIGLFLLVRSAGSTLVAPVPAIAPAAAGATSTNADVLLHVLLALVVVIVAARVCGALCRRIHQPPVIGEVIAGILLGPSLLGRIAPAAMAYLLPPSVAPFLSVIAQIGVILFMFLVGLELDTAQLKHAHACDSRHLARQHPRSVRARLGAGALALSRGSPRATSPSPSSRSSWACRCPLRRSRCSRGSSPIAASTRRTWVSSRSPAPPSMTSPRGACSPS